MTKSLLNSEEGRNLRRYVQVTKAIVPQVCVTDHGAIEFIYDLKPYAWEHKECSDFSRPDNFPPVIVEAIKNCTIATEGVPFPSELLTDEANEIWQNHEEAWKLFENVQNRREIWR